jgi:hypothetical protein
MYLIKPLGLGPAEAHQPGGPNDESGLLEVGHDQPGLARRDGVGFDDA